jgi:GT2 family glycosyltransferase
LPDLCIVVIDDGSTDGTAQAVSSEFPDVEILKGNGNLWWTGAIRAGMAYANRQGCDAIFWLNDDCPPAPGSLTKMYEVSKTWGNAIIGAACYSTETNTLKPTGAQGRTRIAAQPGEILPVTEMSGHCVCIPGTVIDQIGLPDTQRYPHYHGDSSYTLKATRVGVKAYILGDAKVFHPGKIKTKLEDFADFENTSRLQTLNQIFLAQKSLYYLPTQFFYNIDKYNFIAGTGLFFLKLVRWLIKWIGLTKAKPKAAHYQELPD